MTDRAALLAAVLADPADDTPRLVYADFLEETGDPADAARAHFIRAEVEAEKHPVGSPDRVPFDRLAGRLYQSFVDNWNLDLPDWLTADGIVRYRRGFVADVELSVARFVSDGTALFAATPVTALRLRLPHPPGPHVAYGVFGMRPELARVTTLQLGPHTLGPAGYGGTPRSGVAWYDEPSLLDDFLTCPTLTGLRRLILDGNPLDAAWVLAFAGWLPAAPAVRGLEEVGLADCTLDDRAAAAVAAARWPAGLARLNLSGNPISPSAAVVLRERFGDGLVL